MRIYFVVPFIVLFCSTLNAMIITDSLVTDLKCENLNTDSIYQAISPTKAFTTDNQIPNRNWAYYSGFAELANCWSLSHAQRILFYLARFDVPNAYLDKNKIEHSLNMIRGKYPVEVVTRDRNKEFYNVTYRPYTQFSVFELNEKKLTENISASSYWPVLNQLHRFKLSKTPSFFRTFKTESEAYQTARFFDTSNVDLVFKNGTGLPSENYALAKKLVNSLKMNRLPLVDLRIELTLQHIILLKSFRFELNGDISFVAYDSNQPYNSPELFYDSRAGKFRAPTILNRFYTHNTDRNIAVIGVDNQDHKPIEIALLKHYKNKCKTP